MLHQIVFCGNVPHLNEILAFQISNDEFRLLCKSLDDKTVREVAAERAHLYPQMLRRIERLVAIDQLLNNARDEKWELVKQFLRQQPDIVNEKPPYRKYYLAHYLASTGQLGMFIELSNICEIKLDLIADHKTVNRVARENNFIEFAQYIEALCPNINEITENSTTTTQLSSDPDSPNVTDQIYLSHGFNDNPGMMIFSMNFNSFEGNTDFYQDQYPTTTASNIGNDKKVNENILPKMTEEEQIQYEKTVIENMKKCSADSFLNSAVTCCITKAILRDPVLAADGFTYEREAILNWFEQSNRSPMTNQELENKELKPNHAIRSILQSLAETHKKGKQSYDESSINDNTK
ncbi:hypothetical protein I4U23_001997 [Adineta vaga]|nr:hypothetical protein I4U23_001997 [Adineta vaga]